jgi:hypothetical protein
MSWRGVAKPSSAKPWKIEGLAASGPAPETRGKLGLFGQFVGSWVS